MRRIFVAYLILVAVPAAAAILLIAPIGAATRTTSRVPSIGDSTALPHLLIAIAVVVGAAAAGGALAERLGQARVFGELIVGLLLGPTALGALAPHMQGLLFPAAILPRLDDLAQLGVVFFMFLVGLEVSHTDLRSVSGKGVVIGHAAIAVPFLGGVAAAWWLYSHYPPAQPGTLPFILFVALSFSITAFPVLARILDEQRLLTTRLGTLGIGAAGVCDLTAWCLLAVVVAIVHHASLMSSLASIGLALIFTAVMIGLVRPLLARILALADRGEAPPVALYAAIICVLLVSALATDLMGVHAIFGAFLAGLIMPRRSRLVSDLGEKLEGVTLWVLLPLFFVSVGLRTDLGADTSLTALVTCTAIVVIAVTTKIAGAGIAARAVGETGRNALALGVMMNCRGLTELVVLNLGRQLGLLSDALFAMFVIMALVTTGITGPLLRLSASRRAGDMPSPVSAAEPSH